VVVHEPSRDSGLGRDPRDPHVVDALARDQAHGCVEEPVPSL
jgi:hypothetical protein